MTQYTFCKDMYKRQDLDPVYYTDLNLAQEIAWGLISDAVRNRNSAFHTPTLATVTEEGFPSIRTIVLRDCDGENRILRFNSDVRSRKISEMKSNSIVGLHFYDVLQKLQLRLRASATCYHGDEFCHEIWSNMQPMSRLCYLQNAAPGGHLSENGDVPMLSVRELEGAFQNFCVVTLEVQSMDWMYLSSDGHKRAIFEWEGEGHTARWVAP